MWQLYHFVQCALYSGNQEEIGLGLNSCIQTYLPYIIVPTSLTFL